MRFPVAVLLAMPFLTHSGAQAHGNALAAVEIHDRTAGRTLTVYEHRGRHYVAGEPGHQYEIVVRNRSGERLLAVTSVDGINVVSGETAGTHQRGYVLDRWDSVAIDGWRKSLDEVATFYFTRLPDSYAARTGRPDNVGVIGIALFREKPRRVPCCAPMIEQRAAAEAAPPVLQDRGQQDRKPHSSEDALGTGHGHRESSPAQYVDFRRASSSPDETITLYYDSHRNLIAQGVLPARSRFAQEQPDPFPSRFVPDPPDP